jgi:hypothetical protein
LEACEGFDKANRGIINMFDMQKAFSRCKLYPLPSTSEFKKLFKALEIFNNTDETEVNYRKLLEAPIKREHASVNGIFPIIKPKGPT